MGHQAVTLGGRKQRLARHAGAARIIHAQQNFEPRACGLVGQALDRLGEQAELVGIERLLDFGDELHVVIAANQALVLVIVNLDPVAAVFLRPLAGHARGRQGAPVAARCLAELGNTDTDRYLQRLVALQVAQVLAFLANRLRIVIRGLGVGVRQ